MDTTSIVKQAIENEIRAKVFYAKASELTRVGESQMVFLELTDMEDEHARLLVERFGKILGKAGIDADKFLREREAATDSILDVQENALISRGAMDAVITYAIGMEIQARDGYRSLGAKVDDAQIREFCEELAVEEQRHHDLLTNLLKGLDMPDADRPML